MTIWLFHGWGCTPKIWDNIIIHIQDLGDIRTVNLGYDGTITNPIDIQNGDIIIAHSQGVMSALNHLSNHDITPRAFISLCGFSQFCKTSNFPGIPKSILLAMQNRLVNKKDTLSKFHHNGQLPETINFDHIVWDITKLNDGLNDLIYGDYSAILLSIAKRCPIFSMIADNDYIVPHKISHTIFKDITIPMVIKGGHFAPFIEIDNTINFIKTCILKSQRIGATKFNNMSHSYDDFSNPQLAIANTLTDYIKCYIPNQNHILELGAGTGYLTQNIIKHINHNTDFISTDISPNMIAINQKKHPDIITHIMDMNNPDIQGIFQGIYSNMAFQWGCNLPYITKIYLDMLPVGGILAFSIPISDNFPQWQECCDYYNHPHGQNIMPALNTLQNLYHHTIVHVQELSMTFNHSMDFYRHIQGIGAKLSSGNSITNLRKICKRLETQHHNTVTYKIAHVIIKKEDTKNVQ